MRFEGVGKIDGSPYDIVVETTSTYTPGTNLDNGFECGQPAAGCTTGRFMQINVKAGTTVDLTISFQDSATQAPVTIPSFLFSVHDIDQLSSTEREIVQIGGFTDSVHLDSNTEVTSSVESDGRTKLTPQEDGTSCDDPTNPLDLSSVTCDGVAINQKRRSAAFLYQDTSSISLILEVSCDGCPASSSRSFLFTGDTNLVTCA